MKKYLLLAGTFLGLCGTVFAETPNCAVRPTCKELGYVMTADECGSAPKLKCPFGDDSAFFCIKSEEDEPSASQSTCGIGSILYSDKKCYDGTPSGVTPIGVVIDNSRRVAISLTIKPSLAWGGYGTDEPGLDNVTSSNYQTYDTSGYANTYQLVKNSTSDHPAAEYCYNSTEGGMPASSWYLPSAKDLKSFYSNFPQVDPTLLSLGAPAFKANSSTMAYWSSNERTANYAFAINYSGFVASASKNIASATYYTRCAISY